MHLFLNGKWPWNEAGDFIALLVVWVGPFGGVWICDGLLRRGNIDWRGVHSRERAGGCYWGWHGFNPAGCSALLAGMVAAALTMRSPLYDGPIATALGGADLSWLLGLSVSAMVYAAINLHQDRRAKTRGRDTVSVNA